MAIVDQWVHQLANGGGPAFPVTPPQPGNAGFSGMTLRDYFAAAAMQGIRAHEGPVPGYESHWAMLAYKQADAMLAARERLEWE